MSFAEQLQQAIDSCGISKNAIIRMTGIQRPTFFQFLSGKRLPTESQFGQLVGIFEGTHEDARQIGNLQAKEDALNVSDTAVDGIGKAVESGGYETLGDPAERLQQEQLDTLLESYLQERLPREQLQSWQQVRHFILRANRELAQHEGGFAAAEQKEFGFDFTRWDKIRQDVVNFILRQEQDPSGSLDIYLSPELIEGLRMEDLVSQLPSVYQVRQILDVYDEQPAEVTGLLLHLLSQFIGILGRDGARVQLYCLETAQTSLSGQLFPYYLLGDHELLLISVDGDTCSLVQEESLIRAYHEQFDRTIAHLDMLYAMVENYQELSRSLFTLNQNLGEKRLIVSSERPCTLQLIDDAIVDKYIGDAAFAAFAKSYIAMMQALPNFTAMMTREGEKSFAEDHFISESGINLTLDDAEMERVQAGLQRLSGHRLLEVPFDGYFIHGWEIANYEDDQAFIALHSSTECIIHIQNKNLVQALFSYFDLMRRILEK